jgi:hypothetical protein
MQNLGLIGAAGYAYYTEPRLRRDTRTIGTTAAVGLALLGLEGYGAAEYRKTPRGQEEERRARKEGAIIYKHAREVVLRPGVLGGLVGLGKFFAAAENTVHMLISLLANLGVLGGVAYAAYDNWDRPWDRRYVSAATIGLLALWGGEG